MLRCGMRCAGHGLLANDRSKARRPMTGEHGSPEDATNSSRFHLDMTIDDEGQNLSVGERSLVNLARALVKDVSRVAKKWLTKLTDKFWSTEQDSGSG
jgi:ABC-type branched-subunit amino acid transport system ATPase component